jgi:hypothetical protein
MTIEQMPYHRRAAAIGVRSVSLAVARVAHVTHVTRVPTLTHIALRTTNPRNVHPHKRLNE